MDIWLIYVIKTLFLPNSSLLLLNFIGLTKVLKKLTLGAVLLSSSFAGFYVLSTPIVANRLLMNLLEPYVDKISVNQNQAIVLLGSGLRNNATEFSETNFTLSSKALERVRYAAKLGHETGLPILVSGGQVFKSDAPSEATVMAQALENEFHIPVKWQENQSRNTAENAIFSREMLQPLKIDKILLVTHAFHMKRAKIEFEKVGFNVQIAPTAYLSSTNKDELTIFDFLPSAQAMLNSTLALHEYMGLLWYKLRY